MELDKNTNKPFRFEDSRQSKIYASLQRFIADAPALFYKDACKIMQNECELDAKINLVSHLLREIYGWILDFMLPAVDYVEPEGEGNYKAKIKDVVRLYSLDENDEVIQLWLRKITGRNGLHKKAHRDSMGEVPPIDESFMEIWKASETIFDYLLDKIEANYLQYTNQLDHFLTKKNITSNDLTKIKTHIPLNQITLSYFFEKLDKPDCLPALEKKDFFKYPKKPIVHEDGGISFPYWPQMTYLVKMSELPAVQDKVFNICIGIETDNVNVQIKILDIALNLPPDKAVELVKKSYVWFPQIHSWFHAEKYGKLAVYLVKAGHPKEALDLMNKLLEIKPSPRKPSEIEGHTFPHNPVAIIDDWHYEEVLKNDYPALVELTGFDAIKILLDQIENYINISNTDRKKGSKDDYSYIWRNAIEDSAQNLGNSIQDTIISGVRDALELFLKQNPNKIDMIITYLESRKLNIFDRLALHLLRLFPTKAKKLISERLMDKNEFRDASNRLTHEYFLLAEAHSSILNKKQRDEIWAWIMDGADTKAYKKWRKKDYGVDVTEEEVQKYVNNWQMYHLMPFSHIDPVWQEYFDNLVKIVGQPDHPSFRSWTSGGSFGPNSIVSDKQFKEMSPSDVADYLKKWEPDSNDPLDRSREGTSRALTAQIIEDPNKWNDSLSLFSDLDPTYVKAIFIGYRDAVKQDKKFNWEPILNLAETVLTKPIEIKERIPSAPFEDDPDWNWCRNTIVELLSEGLKEGVSQPPISLRDKVWKVIVPLTMDSNPTPEHEEKYLDVDSHDPLSLAINTTRGDALDAAIQYGIWVKNSSPKEEHPKWGLAEKVPELFKVLNDHLDIKIDPSVGIRALYGEKLGQLGWLDEEWIKESKDLIFPRDPILQKYFNAAWEAYITFVPAYDNLFKIIKDQYQRAIDELGKHTDGKHHPDNPEQNLAHHLTVYYWRGHIDLETGLFSNFHKKASIELKSEVIDTIGRVCRNDHRVPDKVRDRFITLLETRIADLKKEDNPKEKVQELKSLSWWIASEKFDDSWMLDKLFEALQMGCDLEGDHLIMERFVKIADKLPLKVIQCSRLLVENDKKGWGVMHWRDDLKSVIAIVLKSQNEGAKNAAIEFVNRLGAQGHLEFKSLLS